MLHLSFARLRMQPTCLPRCVKSPGKPIVLGVLIQANSRAFVYETLKLLKTCSDVQDVAIFDEYCRPASNQTDLLRVDFVMYRF